MHTTGWIARTLMVGALLVFAGCGSYINIPAQRGDVAGHDPNNEDAREAVAEAISAVVADIPIEGQFQIIMPVGTSPLTYSQIATRVSPNAVWDVEARRTGVPVLDVRQIQLRGWDAQIDIVRPVVLSQPEGMEQLVTVYVKYDPMAKWYATRVRVWRMSVAQALLESRRLSDTNIAP